MTWRLLPVPLLVVTLIAVTSCKHEQGSNTERVFRLTSERGEAVQDLPLFPTWNIGVPSNVALVDDRDCRREVTAELARASEVTALLGHLYRGKLLGTSIPGWSGFEVTEVLAGDVVAISNRAAPWVQQYGVPRKGFFVLFTQVAFRMLDGVERPDPQCGGALDERASEYRWVTQHADLRVPEWRDSGTPGGPTGPPEPPQSVDQAVRALKADCAPRFDSAHTAVLAQKQ